jgi:hypothetical protein
MKSPLFLGAAAAGVLALAVTHESAAQAQPGSQPPAAPVHVTIPPGGLTFNFGDIDRNGDGSISVEEWNAFVASLQSRLGAKDSGNATAGDTAAPKQPQPQR